MELAETQKQLQELENKELRELPEKAKLQKEFRKKMDAAKLKVQAFPIWPLGFANSCLSITFEIRTLCLWNSHQLHTIEASWIEVANENLHTVIPTTI